MDSAVQRLFLLIHLFIHSANTRLLPGKTEMSTTQVLSSRRGRQICGRESNSGQRGGRIRNGRGGEVMGLVNKSFREEVMCGRLERHEDVLSQGQLT